MDLRNQAPNIRLVLRYLVGTALGSALVSKTELGQALADNPEVVSGVVAVVAFLIEHFYRKAKKEGGPT